MVVQGLGRQARRSVGRAGDVLSGDGARAGDWAELLITQAAIFPKGKHDDLVDSVTQALSYLRSVDLAQTDEEARDEENERVTHRSGPRRELYQ